MPTDKIIEYLDKLSPFLLILGYYLFRMDGLLVRIVTLLTDIKIELHDIRNLLALSKKIDH